MQSAKSKIHPSKKKLLCLHQPFKIQGANSLFMDKPAAFHKTRLAPTPSGFLHLGNVLSFAITARLAERYNARILLRIDDLDRERAQEPYIHDIFETLSFLQIPWHEGPADARSFTANYSQLHRMHLYNDALQRLKEEDLVFACTCSRAQVMNASPGGTYPGTCRHRSIPLDTPGAAWRLKTDRQTALHVKGINGHNISAVLPDTMREFVVRKKDGFPAYQLASVVDDLHFEVDLVVRGEDLWPSTLAQLYIASVLNLQAFREAAFFHHPLILGEGGEKLSKTAGSVSIRYLRKEGRSAADIFRTIARSLRIDQPVNDWRELAECFWTNNRPTTEPA
jgi:glutamyl/glutaminyl-tRNA synthetase